MGELGGGGRGRWNGEVPDNFCDLQKAIDQTIPDDTETAFTWAEIADTGAMFAAGNPTRIVMPRAGALYSFKGSIQWDGAAGSFQIGYRVNGGAARYLPYAQGDAVLTWVQDFHFNVRSTAAGDYVEILISQLTGGPVDALAGSTLFATVLGGPRGATGAAGEAGADGAIPPADLGGSFADGGWVGPYGFPTWELPGGSDVITPSYVYAFPFIAPKGATGLKVAIGIDTGAAGTDVDVAVYKTLPGSIYPGARIGTGTIDTDGADTEICAAVIALTEALIPGTLYWVAIKQGAAGAIYASLIVDGTNMTTGTPIYGHGGTLLHWYAGTAQGGYGLSGDDVSLDNPFPLDGVGQITGYAMAGIPAVKVQWS